MIPKHDCTLSLGYLDFVNHFEITIPNRAVLTSRAKPFLMHPKTMNGDKRRTWRVPPPKTNPRSVSYPLEIKIITLVIRSKDRSSYCPSVAFRSAKERYFRGARATLILRTCEGVCSTWPIGLAFGNFLLASFLVE